MPKIKLFITAFLVGLMTAFFFDHKVTEQKVDQSHIDKLLKQEVSVDYIVDHVQNALKTDNVELAKEYLSLAELMHLQVSSDLRQQVADEDDFLSTSYRNTTDFFKGALTGQGDSPSSLTGSILSDFTVIGDVRDLSIETKHYVFDEPVDELIAGLSAVGLALSAGTIFSWGSAAVVTLPAKLSVSMVKYAAKTSRLTKQFRAKLADTVSRSVSLEPIHKKMLDLKASQKWNLHSLQELEKVAKDNVHLDEIKKISHSVSNIQMATGGTKGTLDLLGYVKTEKDLKRIEKFSAMYGARSVIVLKVLGKKALQVTKFSVKSFVKMFLMILSGLYALLALLFSRMLLRKAIMFFRKMT